MKKYLTIILAVIFTMVMATGCSEKEDDTPVDNEPTVTETAGTTESTDDAEETTKETEMKYADLIPDPSIMMENPSINVYDQDGGRMYMFAVQNCNADAYSKYVSECKNRGFTDIMCDTEDMFGAHSSDGEYWVQVQFIKDSGTVNVTCSKAENNK